MSVTLDLSDNTHFVRDQSNSQSIFDESIAKIKLLTEKVASFAYLHIIKPSAIGVGVGVASFSSSIILNGLLSSVEGIRQVGSDPIKAAEYSALILESFWETAVFVPIIEEILFRVILQGLLDYITSAIFQDAEVEIFSHKIKLAAVVSVVATSIIFGSAHYFSGLGIIHVINATITGLMLGILRHKQNPLASIMAHITNNSIAILLISTLIKK